MPITYPEIQPPVDHASQTSATPPTSIRSYTPQSSVCRAMNVFADYDLVAPERSHLELIARFAVEAQRLFFTAAVYPPDDAQLTDFFNRFVLFCALPPRAESEPHSRLCGIN